MEPKIKVQSYTFTAAVEPDFFDDGRPAYRAWIPSLPGCFSWGTTVAEALENLEATAKLWIEVLRERGEPIPHDAGEPHIAINLVP
jgi:predicted RNase H-like HicB family nuclease